MGKSSDIFGEELSSACQASTRNFGANFGANFREKFGNFVSNFASFFGSFVQQNRDPQKGDDDNFSLHLWEL